MVRINKTIARLILALIIIFITFAHGNSAEIDDSTVFVEAFNAYQQQDYLLAIEKCNQLNQVFPDSPLRDITLLLTARASLKSGDNERAAKYVTLFSTEFPDSSLKSSIKEDLRLLSGRHKKGEVFTSDKPQKIAADKVRSDSLLCTRAAELKSDNQNEKSPLDTTFLKPFLLY